jgi:hypothetical protein
MNNLLSLYLRNYISKYYLEYLYPDGNQSIGGSGYSVSQIPNESLLVREYKFTASVNAGKYNRYYVWYKKIYLVSYRRETIYNISVISV